MFHIRVNLMFKDLTIRNWFQVNYVDWKVPVFQGHCRRNDGERRLDCRHVQTVARGDVRQTEGRKEEWSNSNQKGRNRIWGRGGRGAANACRTPVGGRRWWRATATTTATASCHESREWRSKRATTSPTTATTGRRWCGSAQFVYLRQPTARSCHATTTPTANRTLISSWGQQPELE